MPVPLPLCLCGSTRGYEILHSAQGRGQVRELLQAVFIRKVGAEPFARLVVARLDAKAALTVMPRQLVKMCNKGEEYP